MKWKQRMIRAEKNKGFTDEDKDLSADWLTCAVSEIDFRKRTDNTRSLGKEFEELVSSDDVKNAKHCYDLIQMYA